MEKNGITLLIEPMSYQCLVGAEIDHTEGVEGAQSGEAPGDYAEAPRSTQSE